MTGFFSRLLRRLALAATAGLLLAGASAHAQNGYTQTRYPIVLVHGLFGFDSALGVDYFYGIPDALRQGGAKVYVAQVSAANSTEVRGEQLLAQVKTILAITGAAKVNLVGHSHGGPTTRYVAGVAPQLVASVTSIGGVNKGSRVADILRGVAPAGSVSEAVANAAAKALVSLINLTSGGSGLPQMPTAALDSLTTAGLANFNRRFPQALPSGCGNGAELVNGVRYYSWTGTKPLTNVLDASDGLLSVMSLTFGEANDGLVSACSSRLGKHLGDYRQNHLDEVNQLLGLRDWFSTDPVTLYRQHANRLKLLGL
ncbi:MAG: triacylglycerol lipase [Gammaproteobacteria bacterium]|jgi:triacylglycerol lipase|nr:triacylglycerol lipase [Gammaproteobacteria bacterium]MBU0826504.1 triacylglycerol lipase [Gammaproteobacteria bacterium]MBU0889506.1 triacylglycerol lipase [Gammaproteobacteria bacterium]MBU1354362.1 triacylglycerol lipase [Gammaproteobacteria bacterium]MBU1507042.1 triacylglycerol lipase [Gammaproteobacteria bacterium]